MGSKFSPKLRMWYDESRDEKNYVFRILNRLKDIFRGGRCRNFALYPQRFYRRVERFDFDKAIDYCFIGGYKTDEKTQLNRQWIVEFIEKNFTDSSYLQFTDRTTKYDYKVMGDFDFTLRKEGFVPKEHSRKQRNYFDENYFQILSKSKFTLCPAGDKYWSMRFYEALMCKSIPIVNTEKETFRSEAEATIGYKYYLASDRHIYREDWVLHNYKIFLKYHTLEYRKWL